MYQVTYFKDGKVKTVTVDDSGKSVVVSAEVQVCTNKLNPQNNGEGKREKAVQH